MPDPVPPSTLIITISHLDTPPHRHLPMITEINLTDGQNNKGPDWMLDLQETVSARQIISYLLLTSGIASVTKPSPSATTVSMQIGNVKGMKSDFCSRM